MEFRILGPLEVVDGTTVVRVAAGRERRLLLLLLIHSPQPVSLSAIVDALWPDDPPSSAQKIVQNYVLRLRKALGADTIETVADGYALLAASHNIDARVAQEQLARAKEALAEGDARRAAELTDAALALWRAEPLPELRNEPFAQPEIARLTELHLSAIEDGFDAKLAAGGHDALIPELRQHVTLQPLRERPRAQLMLALYRSGRQADALAEYRAARRALAEQGLEPAGRLRDLERAMLNQAPELELAVRTGGDELAEVATIPARPRRTRAVATVAIVAAFAAGLAALTFDRGTGRRSLSSLRADTLAEVNPISGQVERWFPVGKTPTAVAVSPNAVWATSFDDHTVTRVDLRTGRSSVVGGPSTPTAIAAGESGVWVASAFDGTVERLDPGTGSVLAVLHLAPGLTDLAVGAGRVWAGNELHGSLTSIDPGTNEVKTTTTGFEHPAGVAFGARRIWVTEAGARRLDAVDPATGRIRQRVPLQLRPGGIGYGAGAVWVIDPADGAVTRVDAFTGRQQVISVGQVPSRVVIADDRAWISVDREHALVVVDAKTGITLKRLLLARETTRASGHAVTPGGLGASTHEVWLAVQTI